VFIDTCGNLDVEACGWVKVASEAGVDIDVDILMYLGGVYEVYVQLPRPRPVSSLELLETDGD
jgi:hypothetical protein